MRRWSGHVDAIVLVDCATDIPLRGDETDRIPRAIPH